MAKPAAVLKSMLSGMRRTPDLQRPARPAPNPRYGHDPITDVQCAEFRTDRHDDAADFRAGREGHGRLELILALNLRPSGKFSEAACTSTTASSSPGSRSDVFQNQVFRWTIGMTHYSFHKELSFDGKRIQS